MNERHFKLLFCNVLRSGHIRDNDLIPASDIQVVEQAHFRSFDLLIAAVTKETGDDYAHYSNMLVCRQLLECFARSEKCRIDWAAFSLLKSNDDTLDDPHRHR